MCSLQRLSDVLRGEPGRLVNSYIVLPSMPFSCVILSLVLIPSDAWVGGQSLSPQGRLAHGNQGYA